MSKKASIVLLAIAVSPLLMGVLSLTFLPDTIIVHVGMEGGSSSGGKYQILITGLLATICGLVTFWKIHRIGSGTHLGMKTSFGGKKLGIAVIIACPLLMLAAIATALFAA